MLKINVLSHHVDLYFHIFHSVIILYPIRVKIFNKVEMYFKCLFIPKKSIRCLMCEIEKNILQSEQRYT